ncbi:MAG: DUF554 domain-containing protein [Ktedonobacteraceae bacterium]
MILAIQQATLPHIPLLGTIINVATVLIGGTLGLVIGNRLPERIKAIVIAVIGLMTLVIGVSSALKTANALIPLLALVVGGVIGELMNIDGGLTHLGEWLKKRVEQPDAKLDFTAAFVIASLQFCVGPLTILGSINDGLSGNFSLLAIKAILDGFSAVVFASTLGKGVLFSSATILIVQGSISLLAGLIRPLLISDPTLVLSMQPRLIELSAAGGVILIGLGLNILNLQRIKVANLLPALLFAPTLVALLNVLNIPLNFGLGK